IFFFPNVLNKYILKPAVYSVYPNFSFEISDIEIWHGFNTELMMTIGIVLLGTVLYFMRNHFKKIFILFPANVSLDKLYHLLLVFADRFSKHVTNIYMTVYLRNYFTYIFVTFIILLGGTLVYLDAFSFTLQKDQSIGTYEWILASTIIISGVTVLVAKSRLTAILVNVCIGFDIAMFFVIFRAPDLALTQLVVETVTTALFLLCFYFLPKWESTKISRKARSTNLIIAISVGTIFTLIALSVNSGRLFTSISS